MIITTTILFASLLGAPAPAAPGPQPNALVSAPADGEESVDQAMLGLVAPIALLPDPLLAQVVAASATPSHLQRAANAVRGGARAPDLRSVPMPNSVRTLTAIPDMLRTLADHMEWVRRLGTEYGRRSAAVLAAVQSLRRAARDAGTLASGTDIRVLEHNGTILIESNEPDAVPVPSWDISTVFSAVEGSPSALTTAAWLPESAIFGPLEIDWNAGHIVHGSGAPFHGSQGVDSRGNPIASGTYYVHRAGPGYEGERWRPNGTVVMPGAVSTQGQPLERATPLPMVAPTRPLMPAQPHAPVQARAPRAPLTPRSPVQPVAYRQPVQPVRPIATVPSNVAGPYAPLPERVGAWNWQTEGSGYSGGSVFGSGRSGSQASERGASSVQGGGQ